MNTWIDKTVLASVIALMVISLVPQGIGVDAQSQPEDISGLQRPILNGLVQSDDLLFDKTQEGFLDEWGDVKLADTTFKDPAGKDVVIKTAVKVYGDEFFVGVVLPQGRHQVDSFSVQIDRDNSGSLTPGDVRLLLLVDDPSHFLRDMTVGQVYDGGWKTIDTFDPNGLPNDVHWGDIILGETFSTGSSANIEAKLDLAEIERQVEGTYPSERKLSEELADHVQQELRYGINVDFIGQNPIGFPEAPVFSQDDTEPTYQAASEVAVYDPIYIEVLPNRDVGVSNIELTQATQTPDNAYRLIEGKKSLARVYVVHDQPGSFIPVRVTLYVYYNFFFTLRLIDTYAQDHIAPPVIRRQQESSSANFVLPAYATNSTSIVLKAEVEPIGEYYDYDRSNDRMVSVFQMVKMPAMNLYRIPFRVYNGTPVFSRPLRPDTSAYSWIDEFHRAIMPLSEANIVDISETRMAPVNIRDDGRLESQLNQLYQQLMSEYRQKVRDGIRDMRIPHFLHGYGPRGTMNAGGSSDPSWFGYWGDEKITWTIENVLNPRVGMQHEINHNIGDDSWSRHVTGYGYGCGAPDGVFSHDGVWEGIYGDNIIHDIGWDGRGLVAASTAELMTYCSFNRAGAWIGGYRWERWIDRLMTIEVEPRRASSPHPASNALVESVDPYMQERLKAVARIDEGTFVPNAIFTNTYRMISGRIYQNGTAALEPSFEAQGIADTSYKSLNVSTPAALLEIMYTNNTVETIPIPASFNNSEFTLRSFAPFVRPVQDNGQITLITLYTPDGKTVLDQRKPLGMQVTTSLTHGTPSRTAGVVLNLGFSDNTTNLLFTPIFTRDDGMTWSIIGPTTTNSTFEPDMSDLPGGTSRFGMLVSDGFTTIATLGSSFSLAANTPKLRIWKDAIEGTDPTDPTPQIPVMNASIGEAVTIDAMGYDQFNWEIPNGNYEWQVSDESGSTIRGYDADDHALTIAFDKAGLYKVKVTYTDAIGQVVQDSVQILIGLSQPSLSQAGFDKFSELATAYITVTETPVGSESPEGFLAIPASSLLAIPLALLLRKKFRR